MKTEHNNKEIIKKRMDDIKKINKIRNMYNHKKLDMNIPNNKNPNISIQNNTNINYNNKNNNKIENYSKNKLNKICTKLIKK